MRGTELLEKLELVDPAYLEAADRSTTDAADRSKQISPEWTGHKRLRPRLAVPIALAACLCLLFVSALPKILTNSGLTHQSPSNSDGSEGSAPGKQSAKGETDITGGHGGNPANSTTNGSANGQTGEHASSGQTVWGEGKNPSQTGSQTEHNPADGDTQNDGPAPVWDFHYNDVTLLADSSRLNIAGYFTQTLHEPDRMRVEPGRIIGWMDFNGTGSFDGEGTLLTVVLSTPSTIPDTDIRISIAASRELLDSCGLLSEEKAVSSYCNGADFLLYQYETTTTPATLFFYAEAEINGLFYLFEMNVDKEQARQAKADFEDTLECFTFYKAGTEDFASITPDEIPEWFDRTLTYQEALVETDFGAYFLPELPDGYQEESIRRYKDQHTDMLSGLWTKGYDYLSWQIEAYQKEDAARETTVADTQNYDLSLYPIPRADSVPEELWEIVDNPIFQADELTLETVYARAYQIDDAGDSNGWRMEFSVRFGDAVVQIHSKGLAPEWIYTQIEELREALSQ